MKKFFFLLTAILLAGPMRPAFAAQFTSLDTSVTINVSSQTASPSTLIASINASAARVELWCYQLNNSSETVMIRSASTGFSTVSSTGTARINCLPYTSPRSPIIIDGYTGPLYAVTNATYTVPVSILRVK